MKCIFETQQEVTTVSYHLTHQHGHTNFWYVCLLERIFLITSIAAIMYGMYRINWVRNAEPRSSGRNTWPKTQVPALIPRPASNGMERMCQSHGSNLISHPPALDQKPLRNQFKHYHISRRGVFGLNHFKLRNFAVVAIESFLQPLIEVLWWPEYIDGPWWSITACRLHLWRPNTIVISIGMEHLSLLKLLFIYLNRLTTIIKFFGGYKI